MSAREHPLWTLALPATLPELVVTPTAAQVFMFSAVTWNRHHIHFDKDAALAEGHSGVVVQRALLGNFLVRMLQGFLGGQGEIREIQWRVQSSAYPNDTLRCGGECVAREVEGDAQFLRCALALTKAGGHTVAVGQARLELR
ncbi:MAG: hypothetical protein ACKVPX_16135 [Myxococcaceae bacterium]